MDDPSVPDQIIVRFSKWKKIGHLFLALLIFGMGTLWIFFPKEDPYTASAILEDILGAFFVILACWYFWVSLKDLMNRNPQLIIGNEGIQRADEMIFPWSEIMDEKIVRKGFGRSTTFHLLYIYHRGQADISLEGLDIGRIKLDQLLRIYRNRAKHSRNYNA